MSCPVVPGSPRGARFAPWCPRMPSHALWCPKRLRGTVEFPHVGRPRLLDPVGVLALKPVPPTLDEVHSQLDALIEAAKKENLLTKDDLAKYDQALADYAVLVTALTRDRGTECCPTVTFGGAYGAELVRPRLAGEHAPVGRAPQQCSPCCPHAVKQEVGDHHVLVLQIRGCHTTTDARALRGASGAGRGGSHHVEQIMNRAPHTR